jgi:hypothetical protein
VEECGLSSGSRQGPVVSVHEQPNEPWGYIQSQCILTYFANISLFEEFYLLGYNTVQAAESQPTFRKNMSPPSPGSKNKPSKKPA